MTATGKDITAAHIAERIGKAEFSLRCREFPPDVVRDVFRYGAIVGSSTYHYGRISRGGDLVRQLIRSAEEKNESFHSGTVILADEMEQSRGRFRRAWHAPRGGLWMTLALVNTLLPESSLLLPMAAGVACCEVIRDYGIDARLKWVNDTMAGRRKISGILTETFVGSRFGEEYILIGIGINVNNNRFPAELAATAVSMCQYLGREIDLPELCTGLLAKLRWNIGLLLYVEAARLQAHGKAAADGQGDIGSDHPLLKSYRNLTDIINRRVLFGFDVQKDPQFAARVIGLEGSGGLILEMDDLSRMVQHSGEITYLD